MRAGDGLTGKLRWPDVSVKELVVAVVFVQLIANAAVLSQVLGPREMVIGFAGFALLMYARVAPLGQGDARCALGWVGRPMHQWVGAVLCGGLLALGVTAITTARGHSIRVVEPIHNQVLAMTLAPIAEEICMRGLLLPILARLIGSIGAVIVSSALFASAHWPASILKLGSILVVGAVYGSIRMRTGSTALAAATHSAYNTTVVLTGLIGRV